MDKVGNAYLNYHRTGDAWVLRLPPVQEFDRSNRNLEQPARLHAAKLEDAFALLVSGSGWLIDVWRVPDLIFLEELAQAQGAACNDASLR